MALVRWWLGFWALLWVLAPKRLCMGAAFGLAKVVVIGE